MKIRSMISSFALVSAMALSGGAFAQSMIGDVAIPTDRMAQFQEKCQAIASVQTESLASPVGDEVDANDEATGSVTTGTDDPDLANEDNIDRLLASMTPDQCKEAGLLDGPVPATSNN